MLARVVAGAFGGPATSLAYSIIADVIPAERRGKAMGAVMGAFSVATVLGVPAGLELAQRGSWRLPFIAVAVLGALLGVFAYVVLPPMRGHLGASRKRKSKDLVQLLRPEIFVALSTTFTIMAAGFVLFPNLSAYALYNLGYPRDRLGFLYLAGGAVSFFSMRIVGRLVDRYGSSGVAMMGTLLVTAFIYLGFMRFPPAISVMTIWVGLMFANSARNVAYNTLMSRVPAPDERARFSSMQSAVQHLAASLAAFGAAQLLTELPDRKLAGMSTIAATSIALGFLFVPLFLAVEARVRRVASSLSST
jgi:predicted MFS family arabinose efflux permease